MLYTVYSIVKKSSYSHGRQRVYILRLACCLTYWKLKMGNSRKYPYHTTDGFHILTPLLPSEFPKCIIPPCPRISKIVNPASRSDFPFFFCQTLRNYLQGSLICPIWLIFGKLFQMTLLLFSTAGYRGSHYDSGNSGMKILEKLKVFSLPLFNRCNLH